MMLKQSASRNLRGARGYKAKHVAQVCLILAVTLWMLYQVRHCYFNKAVLEEKAGSEKGVVKLGRKGMLPGVLEEEEVKGEEFEQVDDLMEESEEQEMEENQSEDVVTESFTMRNETMPD